MVCGGDSGVADGGVVGGHGLRVSKRLPGVFAGEPFRCRFSVCVFRACWLLVIPVPKPVHLFFTTGTVEFSPKATGRRAKCQLLYSKLQRFFHK